MRTHNYSSMMRNLVTGFWYLTVVFVFLFAVSAQPSLPTLSRLALSSAMAASPTTKKDGNIEKQFLLTVKRELEEYLASQKNQSGEGVVTGDIDHPKYPFDFYTKGVIEFADGKYNQAIQSLNEAIRRRLNTFGLFNTLGYSYLLTDQYELAIVNLNTALRISPNATETAKARDLAVLALKKASGATAKESVKDTFICRSFDTATMPQPMIATYDQARKFIRLEFMTANTGTKCIMEWKDGYFGPTFVGNNAKYCSVLNGNDNVHQRVTSDSGSITARFYDDTGGQNTLTLDLNTGILRSTAGMHAECRRAHS